MSSEEEVAALDRIKTRIALTKADELEAVLHHTERWRARWPAQHVHRLPDLVLCLHGLAKRSLSARIGAGRRKLADQQ